MGVIRAAPAFFLMLLASLPGRPRSGDHVLNRGDAGFENMQ
jgi:hypothetical protein